MPEKNNGASIDGYLHELKKRLDLQEYSVKSPAKVDGRSNISHEVDVLIEDSNGKHFILEFTSSDDLVREEEVVRLFAIHLDTNIEVLMVAQQGLTEKATELAKLYGIRVLDKSSLSNLSSILR